jgi:sigma-E factor negative regulatory protein RseB
MSAGVHVGPFVRRRPTLFSWGAGAALALWFCMPAQVVWAAGDSADPAAILFKVQAASRQLDYSGVLAYQQGTTMQSARLIHIVDGTGERERLEILDGAPREYQREDDSLQRLLIPDQKTIIIEPGRVDRFPGLLLGNAKNVGKHYQVKQLKVSSRIAGHVCTEFEILPRDAYRYGYKLCVEPGTNLLLKTQTIDKRGGIVDQVAFSTLKLRDQVQVSQVVSPWDTKDWKVIKSQSKPVDVAKLGWRIFLPPGFESMTQVERPLKSGKAVKQLVYSDGLAAVSVFIETDVAGQGGHTPHKGAARTGAMNIYGAPVGDYWVTAIGEVPGNALSELVKRTEYVPLAATQ